MKTRANRMTWVMVVVAALAVRLPAQDAGGPDGTPMEAILADPGAAVNLSESQLVQVSSDLVKAGRPEAAAAACAAWLDAAALRGSIALKTAQRTLGFLALESAACQAARVRLADHVAQKYLGDAAAVRASGVAAWGDLVGRLSKDLSAEKRVVWAAGIRAAFVDDEEAFAALAVRDLDPLRQALVALGDAQAANLTARWLAETSAWRGRPLRDLASLASALDREGAAGLAILAAHLAEGYPVDGKPDQLGTWRDLAKRLGPSLTADQGAAWASKLRAAYAGPPGLLEALQPPDLLALAEALRALSPRQASNLVAAWFDASTAWRDVPARDRPKFVAALRPFDEGGTAGRLRIAADLIDKGVAQNWQSTVNLFRGDADAVRLAVAQRIRSAFLKDPPTLGALTLDQAVALSAALESLSSGQGAGLLPAWVDSAAVWQTFDAAALRRLTEALRQAGASGRAARLKVADHLVAKDVKANANLLVTLFQADPEPHTAVAAKVRAAAEGLLKAGELKTLGEAMSLASSVRALGDEGGFDIALAWVQASGARPEDMAALLTGLVGQKGAARSTRLKAADWLIAADVGKQWPQVVALLAHDAPRDRAAVAAKVRGALLADPKVFGALDVGTVLRLAGVLRSMGDAAGADLPAEWVEKTAAWQALEPQALAGLLADLRKRGQRGQAARITMANHLIGENVVTQAGRVAALFAADEAVRPAVVGAMQAAMAARIEAGSVETLTEAQAVSAALDRLGEPGGFGLVLRWLRSETAAPADLVALAEDLARQKDAGKAKRLALIGNIGSAYLAEPAKTRSLAPGQWQALVAALGRDLPAESKAAWAAAILGAFAEPPALADLTFGDLGALTATLAALGRNERPGLVLRWVETSRKWQSPKADLLMALAHEPVLGGQTAKAARARVAAYLTVECLTDAQATRSVGVDGWDGMVRWLGKDLAPETRSAWASRLRSVFVEDLAVLSALDARQVDELTDLLANLADAPTAGIVAAWVEESQKWPALKPEALVWAAQQSKAAGDKGRTARQLLAAHLTGTYLTGAKAPLGLSGGAWAALAAALAGDLSDQDRAVWVAALRGAFLDDPKACEGLKVDEAVRLGAALAALGDREAPGVVPLWAERSGGWRKSPPAGLVPLAAALAAAGDPGRAVQRQVWQHLETTYLADAEAARSVSPDLWQRLAVPMGRSLPPDACKAWAARLRQVFLDDAASLASLDLAGVQRVATALQALGDGAASTAAATWIERTTAWRSEKPESLVAVAQAVSQAGTVGAAARDRLWEHLRDTYLADKAATRSVGLAAWSELAGLVGEGLAPSARRAWADRLQAAYAEDARALGLLGAGDLAVLGRAVSRLDPDRAAAWRVEWIGARTTFEDDNVADALTVLRDALASAGTAQEKNALLEKAETALLAKDAAQPLSGQHLSAMVDVCASAGNRAKAQAWAMRAYQRAVGTPEARASVSLTGLLYLSWTLGDVGLLGKGRTYPDYAAAIVGAARRAGPGGPEWWHWWWWEPLAAPIGPAEARTIAEADLLDARGRPDLMVARLLAWVHRASGDLDAWRKSLDEKVAASADPDTKARWLLARASAEALVGTRSANLLRSKQGLDAALAAAQSEPVRLTVVQELADYYRIVRAPSSGLAMLESIKHQFGSEAGRSIAAMEDRLRQQHEARQATESARRAAAETTLKRGRLGYYRKSLERVKARGDAKTAAKLETVIRDLESQLKP
jgi:hypothetical protein